MRQIASFFHVAMNGMAASEKIFRLLILPEPDARTAPRPSAGGIRCRELSFAYEADRPVVKLIIPCRGMTAVAGESGGGKSAVAASSWGATSATWAASPWATLNEVRLTSFLRSENGLDTRIAAKGANLVRRSVPAAGAGSRAARANARQAGGPEQGKPDRLGHRAAGGLRIPFPRWPSWCCLS